MLVIFIVSFFGPNCGDTSRSNLFVNSIYSENIETFWYQKICIKNWYNSKIFENIAYLSCMIICIKTVLIHRSCGFSFKIKFVKIVIFLKIYLSL